MAHIKKPKTTIWKLTPSGKTLVTTIQGLPYGDPPIGTPTHIPGYGPANCSGNQTSGSGVDKTTDEVEFTLR